MLLLRTGRLGKVMIELGPQHHKVRHGLSEDRQCEHKRKAASHLSSDWLSGKSIMRTMESIPTSMPGMFAISYVSNGSFAPPRWLTLRMKFHKRGSLSSNPLSFAALYATSTSVTAAGFEANATPDEAVQADVSAELASAQRSFAILNLTTKGAVVTPSLLLSNAIAEMTKNREPPAGRKRFSGRRSSCRAMEGGSGGE